MQRHHALYVASGLLTYMNATGACSKGNAIVTSAPEMHLIMQQSRRVRGCCARLLTRSQPQSLTQRTHPGSLTGGVCSAVVLKDDLAAPHLLQGVRCKEPVIVSDRQPLHCRHPPAAATLAPRSVCGVRRPLCCELTTAAVRRVQSCSRRRWRSLTCWCCCARGSSLGSVCPRSRLP